MASRPPRSELETLSALLRFFLRLVRSWCVWLRFRSLGGVSFGGRTAEAAFASRTTTFTRAIHAARSALATATTEGLAHFFNALDVLIFGDGAIAVSIQAFEGFFGVAKHAATTTTSAFTFRASTLTGGTRRATFGTWGTTEAAAFTARRTPALATLPPLTTATHHLHHFADLVLINEAVTIGIHAGKTFFFLLLAHCGEFFLADLAVAIGVGAFDECGDTFCRIAPRRWTTLGTRRRWAAGRCSIRRRAFGGVLGAGEAGQAQDAEPVEECFFEFHEVRVVG